MPTQQVQRFQEFTRPLRILKKETEFTRDAMKKVDKPPEPLFDRDQMRPVKLTDANVLDYILLRKNRRTF